jgi:hypothetical protein
VITQFFINLAKSFLIWLAGIFGSADLSVLQSVKASVTSFSAQVASFGSWVDWAVLGSCITVVTGTWVVASVIKLVRAVVAHIPAIGGAGD